MFDPDTNILDRCCVETSFEAHSSRQIVDIVVIRTAIVWNEKAFR